MLIPLEVFLRHPEEFFEKYVPVPEEWALEEVRAVAEKSLKVTREDEWWHRWLTKSFDEVVYEAARRLTTMVQRAHKKRKVRTYALKEGNMVVKAHIWNMPEQASCPVRTRLCARWCYAGKRYGKHVYVTAYRLANLAASARDDFEEILGRDIEKQKAEVVRIHEAGDFYSTKYAEKVFAVAERYPETLFQAYTKSAFVLRLSRPENFILNYSFFYDNLNRLAEGKQADNITYVISPVELYLAWAKFGILDEPFRYKRDIIDSLEKASSLPAGTAVNVIRSAIEKLSMDILSEIADAVAKELLKWDGEWVWCRKETESGIMCVRDCNYCYEAEGRLVFFLLH